jgi:hypothetical protein
MTETDAGRGVNPAAPLPDDGEWGDGWVAVAGKWDG